MKYHLYLVFRTLDSGPNRQVSELTDLLIDKGIIDEMYRDSYAISLRNFIRKHQIESEDTYGHQKRYQPLNIVEAIYRHHPILDFLERHAEEKYYTIASLLDGILASSLIEPDQLKNIRSILYRKLKNEPVDCRILNKPAFHQSRIIQAYLI